MVRARAVRVLHRRRLAGLHLLHLLDHLLQGRLDRPVPDAQFGSAAGGVAAHREAHVALHIGACHPEAGRQRQQHRFGCRAPGQGEGAPVAGQEAAAQGDDIGVLGREDVAAMGLGRESRRDMGAGHLAHVHRAQPHARGAHAGGAVDQHPHDREALAGRGGAQGRAEDEGRVDDHQVPPLLARGEPPRLLLRQRLGVGVWLVGQGGGGVPAVLGQDPPRVILDVGGVAEHGRDGAGEHHPPDRWRPPDAVQHVARPLQRRVDQVPLGIIHVAHEGRGRVDDDAAPGHRLVVGAGLEQVGGEELQRPRGLLGGALQVRDLARRLRVADRGVDGGAGIHQPFDYPAAQVAGGAGDQDRGGRVHWDAGEIDAAGRGWLLSAHGSHVKRFRGARLLLLMGCCGGVGADRTGNAVFRLSMGVTRALA